jgi:hypothetical protein
VTATDSIGRVIEGELDEITGEIIIYTSAMLAGVTSDDGDGCQYCGHEGCDDCQPEHSESCIECSIELEIDEINAAFNSNNPPKEKVCKACYADAMQTVLHG